MSFKNHFGFYWPLAGISPKVTVMNILICDVSTYYKNTRSQGKVRIPLSNFEAYTKYRNLKYLFIKMDFNFTSNKFKFVTNHTFHIMENISFDEQSMGVNNPTTAAHMMALYCFFFLIVEIPGNLLLLSMIYYEKYGMDPHKRTVTNKLLTSICVSFLLQNVIAMPILMFNRIDPHPTTKCKKIFKWGYCGLILKVAQ